MSSIVLLDTSVYLNVLDVPGRNQKRESVFDMFERKVRAGDTFLLPMAAIWETGNHIACLHDGGHRRRFAEKLVEDVGKAMNGETPYRPTYLPDREVFLEWLRAFPDYSGRNKSAERTREGVSFADLSIIKEWERTRDHHTMRRVCIWSLDIDLASYDSGARR